MNNQAGQSMWENHPLRFSVTQFNAIGDGKTDNTQALNQVISACSQAGGGVVVFPPGVYLTGPLQLLSRVTLHLEAGSVIQASAQLEDYPVEVDRLSMESERSGLITARDAQTISITGRGMIDGGGFAFIDKQRLHEGRDFDRRYTRQGEEFMHPRYGTQHGPLAHGDRPGNLLRFFNCANVLLEGVTIQNSPTWTVHFSQCDGVDILGVKINSRASDFRVPNDDGIDLVRSNHVHIANCDIQTGDDCIAVFASQNITVSNCTLSARSSGIRVGYDDDGDTINCLFNNLVIHSNRGLNLNVRGKGNVENILFTNIVIHAHLLTGHWWGKAEPIHVSAMPMTTNTQELGQIRNVLFKNILAEGESGILIHGCAQSRIQNLALEGIRLKIKKGPLQESYGGNFDLRTTSDLSTSLFKHDIPGLYACFFDGLEIRDFHLSWDEGLPEFFTHGIECEHFTDLTIAEFRGGSARPKDCQAVQLTNGQDISIKD